jgi:subtilisin family serine protease
MSRRARPAGRAAVAAVALAAAAALLPAAALASSGPAKDEDPEPLGSSPAAVAEVGGGFGRTLPGPQTLLVTFSDAPNGPRARARLDDLGSVRPVLPEAGVWSLSPRDPAAARDRVLDRPRVSGAEWSLARSSAELPRPAPPLPLGPPPALTDPLYAAGSQWGILAGRSTWGGDLTTIGPRPRIAILDSGVDPTHEEWGGPASPLVAPRSTLRSDDDGSDDGESGHGTHVAGIAAAPANGVGVVGVAPAVRGAAEIIPVQIANRDGESSDLTMIRGIRYAVRNGARVVNISAGGPGFSRAFQDAILWATRQGALIVASVGNEGGADNTLNYPAAYRRVIGVGAQCDDQPSPECPRPFGVADFSNRNRTVDVIAPGVNVLSSVPKRVTERVVRPGYALKDGTSMAAPYISGVAALVMAANGQHLSPYQVRRQIENTADDIGPAGRDNAAGYGVVNPRAAVTLTAPADDAGEVNDDVKWLTSVQRLSQLRPGQRSAVEATVDRFEDPDDVLAVRMNRGERIRVTLTYRSGVADLYLWRPGTTTVGTGTKASERNLIKFVGGRRKTKTITYKAKKNGRHFVNVYARRGGTAYTVTLERLGPR